jgi:hypothetical protein
MRFSDTDTDTTSGSVTLDNDSVRRVCVHVVTSFIRARFTDYATKKAEELAAAEAQGRYEVAATVLGFSAPAGIELALLEKARELGPYPAFENIGNKPQKLYRAALADHVMSLVRFD